MGRMTKHPLNMLALRLRRARYNSTLGGKPVRQIDVARMIGVAHSTYWRWEAGIRLPYADNIAKLAKLFQMDQDEVWLDTGHIPPDILVFLVTTREGLQTVKNIRRIMNQLNERQKPTRRREIPYDFRIPDPYFHSHENVRKAKAKLEKDREEG